jgi:N-acetylmuramoyl-L-alanine amidase
MSERLRAIAAALILAVVAGTFIVMWAVSATNTIHPAGIILHHTALMPPIVSIGTMTADRLPDDVETWDDFHKRRGFGAFYWGRYYHIGYHYMILPDGTVKQGRPEHCVGAHARGFNDYIGIVLVGDFSSKDNPHGEKAPPAPSRQQMDAVLALCRTLKVKYSIPLARILRHRDVARTECPGDRFPYAELIHALQ